MIIFVKPIRCQGDLTSLSRRPLVTLVSFVLHSGSNVFGYPITAIILFPSSLNLKSKSYLIRFYLQSLALNDYFSLEQAFFSSDAFLRPREDLRLVGESFTGSLINSTPVQDLSLVRVAQGLIVTLGLRNVGALKLRACWQTMNTRKALLLYAF